MCVQTERQRSNCRTMGDSLRCRLASMGIPIAEISQSDDSLITTVGFPILVRRHLYIESGPSSVCLSLHVWLQAGRGLWVCHSRGYRCSGGGHVARMFGDGEEEKLNSGMCPRNSHHGFNSLRPGDAYMRQCTNHHWFR